MPSRRTFEQKVEHAIRLMMTKQRQRPGEEKPVTLTADQKIKLLAVAVRLMAVKRGITGGEGAGFEEEGE